MINLNDHSFRKRLKLTLNEMAVLKEIEDNTDPYFGWCSKSKNSIANEINVTKNTVLNALDKLEQLGYLNHDKQTGCCKVIYDLIYDLKIRNTFIKPTFYIKRYTNY